MKLTKVAKSIIAEDSGALFHKRIAELERDKRRCNLLWNIAPMITKWLLQAAKNFLLSVIN
jgi:hypothetical protein